MAGQPNVCQIPEDYRVGSLETLYYVPNFISSREEEQLLQVLKTSKAAWKEVRFKKKILRQLSLSITLHAE